MFAVQHMACSTLHSDFISQSGVGLVHDATLWHANGGTAYNARLGLCLKSNECFYRRVV